MTKHCEALKRKTCYKQRECAGTLDDTNVPSQSSCNVFLLRDYIVSNLRRSFGSCLAEFDYRSMFPIMCLFIVIKSSFNWL